jgi:pSer/pThr/pTyr-binding forkhead associated (FHA) protein
MGLFQRLFSTEYRKAVAAEAAGDFLAAARCYALCGELSKVSDMHLAQARRESTLEGRIRSLRNALDFAGAEDDEAARGRRSLVQRLLAEALRRQGQRLGPATNEGRQATLEAAESFVSSRSYETAGEVFLEAGDTQRAVEAFSKAGLVERVEVLLAELDQQQGRDRRRVAAFKDYELHMRGGQRDRAAEALRRCIDAAEEKGEYRRLYAQLEARLLRAGCLQLEIGAQRLSAVGKDTVVIGRDPSCDVVVRGPSVSRRHTRIVRHEGALWLEDAGSRNGTLLGGLALGARVPLPSSAEIGLGDSAAFSVDQLGQTQLALRVTRGMDRDKRVLVAKPGHALVVSEIDPALPPLLITFREGRPWLAARDGALSLDGQRVIDEIQAIADDELELAGARLRVLGG